MKSFQINVVFQKKPFTFSVCETFVRIPRAKFHNQRDGRSDVKVFFGLFYNMHVNVPHVMTLVGIEFTTRLYETDEF